MSYWVSTWLVILSVGILPPVSSAMNTTNVVIPTVLFILVTHTTLPLHRKFSLALSLVASSTPFWPYLWQLIVAGIGHTGKTFIDKQYISRTAGKNATGALNASLIVGTTEEVDDGSGYRSLPAVGDRQMAEDGNFNHFDEKSFENIFYLRAQWNIAEVSESKKIIMRSQTQIII